MADPCVYCGAAVRCAHRCCSRCHRFQPGPRPLCQHCRRRQVNRPRGLCWSCYYAPAVRDLYPSASKYARRGVGDFNGKARLPARPTLALPGSPEKVAVLEERAREGKALWHPQDNLSLAACRWRDQRHSVRQIVRRLALDLQEGSHAS